MRLITTLLFILFVYPLQSEAQWKKCTKVVSDPLYSVSVCDSFNVLASGGEGTVIRSTNAGMSWSIDSLPTIQAVHQVISISKNIALAFTRWDGIFKTTNSGKNWTKVSDIDLGGDFLRKLVDDAHNSSIYFGIANSSNSLYKSLDSGSSWTLVSNLPTNYELTSIKFIDKNVGFVCGNYGILLKTSDGGINWEKIARGSTSDLLYHIQIVNDTVFISGAENGTGANSIYYININGADSLIKIVDKTTPPLTIFSFSGKNWWNADNQGGFYFTSKIDSEWEKPIYRSGLIYHSMDWYNSTGIGYYVTAQGEVFKTTNHGIGDCTLEIVKSPKNTTAPVNVSSGFKVSSNDSTSKIQWQTKVSGLEWINLQNNNTYSNVNSDSLIVSNITVNNHNQQFRAIVDNNLCKDTSETATLTVLDTCINKRYDTIKVSVADTLIIKTKATGIQENKYYTFLIYPNPTSSQVIIDCGDNTEVSTYSYTITNSLGQEKLTSKFTSRYQQIDISGIGGTGLYIITIKDGNNTVLETRKLLIQ